MGNLFIFLEIFFVDFTLRFALN